MLLKCYTCRHLVVEVIWRSCSYHKYIGSKNYNCGKESRKVLSLMGDLATAGTMIFSFWTGIKIASDASFDFNRILIKRPENQSYEGISPQLSWYGNVSCCHIGAMVTEIL